MPTIDQLDAALAASDADEIPISQGGTAVLVATHDYQIIRAFPSRIIKCDNGKVLEDVQIA